MGLVINYFPQDTLRRKIWPLIRYKYYSWLRRIGGFTREHWSAIVIKKGRRRVAFALSHSSNRLTLGLKGLALLVELDNSYRRERPHSRSMMVFLYPKSDVMIGRPVNITPSGK